jgi:hypothetical protein
MILLFTLITSLAIFLCVPLPAIAQVDPNLRTRLQEDPIIIDHNSLHLFDIIPETYVSRAQAIRMMWADRSVGGNISSGLDCLTASSNVTALTSCKRQHTNPDFPSPDSWVTWNRSYPRTNWQFYFDPGLGVTQELSCSDNSGMWHGNIGCFIEHVRQYNANFDVFSYQHSYLTISETSNIASPTDGYFVNRTNGYDIYDYQNLETEFPSKVFIYWTTSLARSTGTLVGESYNGQMRQFAAANNKILFDVADIESFSPSGAPCYDNRDGVAYCTSPTSTNCENLADDGLNITAICQHYTTEPLGGHLQDRMKVMMGKMYWVLMAQIAGWRPGSTPPTMTPPSPTPTSPSSTPTPTQSPYDLNLDGQVNYLDLLVLTRNFNNGGTGDFDQNGRVSIFDFTRLFRELM